MSEQPNHKAQRDPFSKAKDEFLLAAIRDGDVGEAGFRLAVALTVNFANREKFEATGELMAWPSQRLLSDTVQMHRARVDRAAKALEQAGLLTVLRPEKPGPGKHNRYTMVMPTGLTGRASSKGSRHGRAENLKKKTGPMDEASSEHTWPHNYVASSTGETGPLDRASSKPGLAPSVGPELAPRVGPNSLEEPLDGAGAQTRPAPFPAAGSSHGDGVGEDHQQDTDAKCGLPALEAPAPASSDHAPGLEMEERAFAVDADDVALLIPDVVADGLGSDFRLGHPVTLADLDRLAADERGAHLDIADELAAIFPALTEPDLFVSNLITGFGNRLDDLSATEAAKVTADLLGRASGHDAAAKLWRQQVAILSRVIEPQGLEQFMAAVAVAMAARRSRKTATPMEVANV